MQNIVKPRLYRRRIVLGAMAASSGCLVLTAAPTLAHENAAHKNDVKIVEQAGQRCILSNGMPNHQIGTFPRRGNPNSVREQSVRLCMPASPTKGQQAQRVRGSIGVALNGVQIRPGTADWYDGTSRRGFSRNPASGWNLEGMGARQQLGMDQNNAHVDERGLYHYHAVSKALSRQGHGSLIGYAADGFEIHYVGNKASSSYRLKRGSRPSAPGGRYDGTYNQDWAYVAGSGSLDQCNGGYLNGAFVYFATDSYPFFPRCLWGTVSRDFLIGRGPDRGQGGQPPQGHPSRPDRPDTFSQQNERGFGAADDQRQAMGEPQWGTPPQRDDGRRVAQRQGPPEEAMIACQNRGQGQACEIQTPFGHQLSGVCGRVPSGQTACMPEDRGPRRRP